MISRVLWRSKPNAWRNFLQTFSPQTFTMCMGTGISALTLQRLPYKFSGLGIIVDILFCLVVLLSLVFLLCFLLRIFRWPSATWRNFNRNLDQTVCLACAPIALGTIVDLFALICAPTWGHGARTVTIVLFSIEIFWAVCNSSLSLWLIIINDHIEISQLPPTIMFPSISCVTAAASGGTVASFAGLPNNVNMPIIVLSFFVLGFGIGTALIILSVYCARLLTASVPDRAHATTSFLCFGPLSQGAYGFLVLGSAFRQSVTSYDQGLFLTPGSGTIVYPACVIAAFMLLGFSCFWIMLAVSQVLRRSIREPFTLEFWAVVYPLGVTTLVLEHLGSIDLDSTAFKVLGTGSAIVVLSAWMYCMAMSIPRMLTGELFGLDKVKEKDGRDHQSATGDSEC